MKRLVAVATACLALACSTGTRATVLQPELELVQLVGPQELNYPQGSIEIQYGLRIANRSSEPISLRQIRLESLGTGGPYRLRRETYPITREIQPNAFADVTFWAKAFSNGDFASIDASAPVTVRGTAYFESAGGDFRQIFVKTLTQMGGSRRPR